MSNYFDYLPDAPFDECDLWRAIADSLGVDVIDIIDGDLADYV